MCDYTALIAPTNNTMERLCFTCIFIGELGLNRYDVFGPYLEGHNKAGLSPH